ncbi:MAG: Daunorubicin/doxorubicin resistance ATP-binding protein DrrA [Pseudomonadota bacterium]
MTSISADALHLEGVVKEYGSRRSALRALNDVTLRVPRGQLFGLIGHNGAGKSTLFKLVLGLSRPSQGSILVNGCDVGGSDFRQTRRTLGYLPENLVLYDNLTGIETLQFFARLKGAAFGQCQPLLERVGLAAAANRAVREYSKGMRQRLGFAQALLGKPQLLLLDEPTTGLDPAAIRQFYEQLDELRAEGVTLVISSHILAELEQRVDTLAMLSNGRVIAQGSVQGLRDHARMPLKLVLTGSETVLQAVTANLQGQRDAIDLAFERTEPGRIRLHCPREHKMALLAQLGAAGLSDLQVLEPTLEDIYFGLKESA